MTRTLNDYDIAICGAGPVGQCLALLLHKHGIAAERMVLFDAKTSQQAEQDARTIALSQGSQQILASAGGWPVQATPIREIHVSRRGQFGRSLITAEEYRQDALGYVAQYGDIIRPLQQQLAARQIRIVRPQRVQQLDEQADHVRIQLQDVQSGQTSHLSAGIVVQAEGGTFSDQSQRLRRHDYQQIAIIGHLLCDQPMPQRAFERFTEQGPLALLPQQDGYALVWCVRPERAEQLMALDEAGFLAELQLAFGQRLGQFIRISQRLAYPLGLNAQSSASARTVCIGNAAQTLHPVAGQGLNLGLRDAAVLANCLVRDIDFPEAALQSFLQQRSTDRSLTINLTDSLARVFASSPDQSLRQGLLGLGLGLLDLLPPAKKLLADHMMYGWRS